MSYKSGMKAANSGVNPALPEYNEGFKMVDGKSVKLPKEDSR